MSLPATEAQRLEELRSLDILDDESLHDSLQPILRVAAFVSGAPTAIVNIIDEGRQWQAGTLGSDPIEVPREDSMCATTVLARKTIYVPDARADDRFADNPFVTGRLDNVRLYAGAPLTTPSGHAIGTLCVIDKAPRTLTRAQIAALEDLAQQVLILFEGNRQAKRVAAAEAELRRRNEALERSNGALARFASVAAHDLASPLATMSAYAEIIQMQHGGRLPADARASLDKIVSSAMQMRDLIAGILEYSRMDAVVATRVDVDTNVVVDEVIASLQRQIEDANVRVIVGPLPVVPGNAVMLRQLFQNLIANAIKFRSDDRPPSIDVSAGAEPERWTFTVADNGIGVPAEHRDSVFELFHRVRETGRAGHGIGLSTCRRVVDWHGGRIWMEPRDGGGSAFRFTIPEPF